MKIKLQNPILKELLPIVFVCLFGAVSGFIGENLRSHSEPINTEKTLPNTKPINSIPPSVEGTQRELNYNPSESIMPATKGDNIAPLYNEVQRRKLEQGISDKEAVNQILEEMGEIK